jgi:hypothetical protein
VGMMYSINARISFQRAILSDGETVGCRCPLLLELVLLAYNDGLARGRR